MSTHKKSFFIIFISMVFFLAGTCNIRFSLVPFLESYGLNINQGFLLATTLAALQLVFAYLWPRLFRWITPPRYSDLIATGTLFSSIGLALLTLHTKHALLLSLGLSFFILGNSLFLLNARTLVNFHATEESERQRINQVTYLGMNLGAFLSLLLGGVIFLLSAHIARTHTSFALLYFMDACLLMILWGHVFIHRREILNPHPSKPTAYSYVKFLALLVAMLFAGCGLLSIPRFTQILVPILFCIGMLFVVKDRKSYQLSLRRFFILIFCNMMFWTILAIMYYQFSTFIRDYVNTAFHQITFPGILLYAFDPGTNLIAGLLVTSIYADWKPSSSFVFSTGFFALGLSFLVLYTAITLHGSSHIHASWVVAAILIYGFGEFLIAPTLIAQLAQLSPDKTKLRSLMGVLSLSTATANSLSYFIMKGTIEHSNSIHTNLTLDMNTYFYIALFLVGISGIIPCMRMFKVIFSVNVTNRGISPSHQLEGS
ncbi:MAG: hypothetical protein EBX40_00720 [Gammaproteobacteria bacterium]|nr:hypothetical protein [Gammaproteobacteria bacterium]